MIGNLLLSLLKNKWVWISIAVFGVGYYVYGVIQDNRELRAAIETRRQNEIALQDSVSKMKDSVQVLAVKVQNIQSEQEEWKRKYVAVNTKYELALDEISVWKNEADSLRVIGDSLVVVSFSGKQGIVTYTGKTEANLNTNVKTYSLSVLFDEIRTESYLFFDEADSLWKIKSVSLSPGVTLRGLSTLDDEVYRKIQGLKPIHSEPSKIFAVGGLAARDRLYGGVVLTPSQWMFSLHYKLFDKYLDNERWSDKIMVGVHYFLW